MADRSGEDSVAAGHWPRDDASWRSAFAALDAHRHELSGVHLRELFSGDPERFGRYSLTLAGGAGAELFIDYSKHLATHETFGLLLELARASGVAQARTAMFSGEKINITEDRPVLHVALRGDGSRRYPVDGVDVMPQVLGVLDRLRDFTTRVHDGSWRGYSGERVTDVVNLGIGGSHLGPQMAVRALEPYAKPGIRVHFVSNVDGAALVRVLAGLDPARTLFLIASKTFTTQETMMNARSSRDWLLAAAEQAGRGSGAVAKHFVALSTNAQGVAEFGIDTRNMFEFWDWVGGRYSLWSAIGLSIALAVGFENFEELLAGGRAVDEHFLVAPLERNAPVLLGLLGVWYRNFFGAQSKVVLPYDESLEFLPSYLQQADMESNGKRVDRQGREVPYETGPVVWGEPGTNGQHAFFQLLHQGTIVVPADFIAPARSHYPLGEHHRVLLANFVAQTQALMRGRGVDETRDQLLAQGYESSAPDLAVVAAAKSFPGDRPSTSILMPLLTPRTLGMLIALYEHQIFVQGVVWNVNSFDQMGVELGKELAMDVLANDGLTDDSGHDSSTAGLLAYLGAHARS